VTGPDGEQPRVLRDVELVSWGPVLYPPWPSGDEQAAPVAGRHQEGERREDSCGCQFTWCRGRWHPSGLVCGQHWPEDPEAAAIMRRGPDE
jgi:hypothetical protein